MSDVMHAICMHGGLRRQCEPCDLADRLETAAARVQELEHSTQEMAQELHAAINEPMYAGTRRDWIDRAYGAEARIAALEREVAELETLLESRSMEIVKVTEDNIRLEREVARLKRERRR